MRQLTNLIMLAMFYTAVLVFLIAAVIVFVGEDSAPRHPVHLFSQGYSISPSAISAADNGN
jgi:hypothetical protein